MRPCSPTPPAGAGSSEDASGAAAATAAFTKRTALVLEHMRREFAPSTGSKRRHPSAGDLAAGVASLSLDGLLGASQEAEAAGRPRHGRLDAARWFYESLVLRSTGFVTLEQVGGGRAAGWVGAGGAAFVPCHGCSAMAAWLPPSAPDN